MTGTSRQALPREILKWTQSLDLSYSIVNHRRDFANGFLVAEIFSRYYKAHVPMHSYDNGTSMKKRKSNWGLLKKFFKKKGFSFTDHEINRVINCEEGAAVEIMVKIFELLTKTKVQVIDTNDDEYVAPYTRPTATTRIANRMRDADMVEADRSYQRSQAVDVVDAHNETLRAERIAEPHRFVPQRSSNNSMNRVPTRKVSPSEYNDQPQIHFKGVKINQVEENISQLRANHSSRGAMGNSLASTSALPVGATGSLGAAGNATGAVGRVVKPSVELLNSCVNAKLDGTDMAKRLDPRKDAMVCFVEDVRTFPDTVAAEIFSDMAAKMGHLIAENCLASPKEFWQFFDLCWTAITKLPDSSAAYSAAVGLVEAVGRCMTDKDQHVPFALLKDFGLPKIILELIKEPYQPKIVGILFAFSVDDVDEHINIIRLLRDGLDDFDTFVVCLSSLVRLESTFTTGSLDLYLYYVIAGLTNSSPVIRGTCVSMLAPIARAQDVQGDKQVVSLFDRLEELSDSDPSWQVQSAVLSTSCALLTVLPPKDPLCTRLYDMVDKLTAGDRASSMLLQTAVVALSSCVGTHEHIRECFANLIWERPDVVQRALGQAGGPAVATTQENIGDLMDQRTVAVIISELVKKNKPDNLAQAHIRLLAAAVDGVEAFAPESVPAWMEVYSNLRDHLVVELYEPSTCSDAVKVLKAYLLNKQTQAMASELLATGQERDPPMYGILKYIFPDGDEVCKTVVAKFLGDLSGLKDTDFPDMIYKLLKNFEQLEADKYIGSALELVVERLEE